MREEDFIKYLGNNNISIFSFDDEAEFIEEMNTALGIMIEPYIFFKMLSKSALHNAINGVELTITLRIIPKAVFDEDTAKKDSACLQIKQNLD